MFRVRDIVRVAKIFRVLKRHGLDDALRALHPKRPFSWLLWLTPESKTAHAAPLGERLRLALEDLGPIFVKFGQALSTRPDLLPPDIARELAKLQDAVPPFDSAIAVAQIEKAYGQTIAETFATFDEKPLASASIAQVHTATLADGSNVVVKILRPGIAAQIDQDLGVMHALANLVHKYWEESRRLRPREIVREYDKTIHDELDMMREAANASQLRRNFEDGELLYVPKVYWDFCKPDVLVIERVGGVPVSDIDTLNANNVNLKVLADRGVEIFFTQVFRHNFFHADMHPGNIFVDISKPELPSYVSIDFGIIGTLTPSDQHYLAGNLLAFFKRDYAKIAQLHVESGWVPRDTRADEFEAAIRTVCEPIFNRPLKEISFGQFLVRLFSTARRFSMEVQPQLVLLQKTLLNIEGLGRQLYPDLDLWQTAKPFLEEWMDEQTSGAQIMNKVRDNLPQLSESLQALPQLIYKTLQNTADGQFTTSHERIGPQQRDRDDARKRYCTMVGCGALIAAALLLGLDAKPAALGWGVGAASFWLLWRGRP